MMISISAKKYKNNRQQGVALLVVLFIVMVITILSLGFLSRSDVELACGQNMILRTQMDYLAESGLEHARGLILNPQDVVSEFWTGAAAQQLVEGSDDYYIINVDKLSECNYQITCDAYREKMGEKVGRSSLRAELRLDPCIAFWTGGDTIISSNTTIYGDVYCSGNLTNNGIIDGDAFAGGTVTGAIAGRKNELVSPAPVVWPGLVSGDFGPTYYIGSTSYSAEEIVDANVHPMGSFIPSVGNPAGIRYRSGDLEISNEVHIQGMLVVTGDLRITGANNDITAVKNFPALLVSGNLIIEDGCGLDVYGLAVVEGQTQISAGAAGVNIIVIGGLFVKNGIVGDGNITITAAPAKTAIVVWSDVGIAEKWGQAAGAFFRNIERK
jgi:hypothetical protein